MRCKGLLALFGLHAMSDWRLKSEDMAERVNDFETAQCLI